MQKTLSVAGLVLFLLALTISFAFGGTIHVPEEMKGIAYGVMSNEQPYNVGLTSFNAIGVQSFDPLENWHLVNPVFEGGNITALAVGNGTIVALVDAGTAGAKIVATTDGIDWVTKLTIPGAKPYAIVYAKNRFVAVGKAMITYSLDGTVWPAPLYSGGTDDHWDVTYGKSTDVPDGTFVAVGINGKIMTSPNADGIGSKGLWTTIPVSYAADKTLNGVANDGKIFVAVGDGCRILTAIDPNSADQLSPNSWKIQPLPAGCTATTKLKSIAYGNGRFVVTTDKDIIFASTDGKNWTKVFAVLAHNINKVVYLKDQFIAIGNYGTILSSPDGLTWTIENFADTSEPNLTGIGLALDGETFIVVGKGIIMTSSDLSSSNWTKWTLQSPYLMNSVGYGVNKFVATGDNLTIQSSPDAGLWPRELWGGGTSTYSFKSVTFGKISDVNNPPSLIDGFVAVGGNSTENIIVTSPDGHIWTETDLGGSITTTTGTPPVTVTRYAKLLNGVTYGNNMFVAVGAAGTIMTSGDGDVWDLKPKTKMADDTVTLYGVTFGGPTGNKNFIAVGDKGKGFKSADGDNWASTGLIGTSTAAIYGVTYGGIGTNAKFVAVGSDKESSTSSTIVGKIYTSADGSTWIEVPSYPSFSPYKTPKLYGVFWDAKTSNFYVIGEKATILSSPDGITWTVRVNDPDLFPSSTIAGSGTATLRSIAYGNNVYVAVGDVSATYAKAGLILKSDPLVPPAPVNIKATSTGANTVSLSWDDKTNEKNFQVFRKKGTGAWTKIATLNSDVVTYSDASATGNNSSAYSYYLKACNSRYCSASSKTVLVPFPPSGLVGTVGNGKINLSWAESSNENGYEIYKKTGTVTCTSPTGWILAGTVAANVHTFSDTVGSGKTFTYKVRSLTKTASPYSYGYSGYSNCVTKTTP